MASKADYEAFFREADADNSGFLTMKELSDLLQAKGYRGSKKELENFFKDVDTSGDGKISHDEYMVAMGQQPPKVHGEASMRACFRSFDKDGNGTIDRNELDAVFKEMGRTFNDAELKRMIQLMDKDKSGTVDYEEFIAAMFGK